MKNTIRALKADLAKYLDIPIGNRNNFKHFKLNSDIYKNEEQYQFELTILSESPTIVNIENECHFKMICPHRGAKLTVTESGFICPFHGWTFDKDGRLIKAAGENVIFRPGTISLSPAEGFMVGGIGFSHKHIGPFDKEIETLTKNSEFLLSRLNKIKCNWKLLIDSLLETYHFQFAHKEYLSDFENSLHTRLEIENKDIRTLIPLDNFKEHKDTSLIDGINIMYFKYPSSFLLVMQGSYVWFDIKPRSIASCELKSFCFTLENGDKEKALISFAGLDKILQEDYVILEGQQDNLISMHGQNLYLTPYESGLKHFHDNMNYR
jgi:nitrite reductase/ring-hydroxylating ferredoxin subunit